LGLKSREERGGWTPVGCSLFPSTCSKRRFRGKEVGGKGYRLLEDLRGEAEGSKAGSGGGEERGGAKVSVGCIWFCSSGERKGLLLKPRVKGRGKEARQREMILTARLKGKKRLIPPNFGAKGRLDGREKNTSGRFDRLY